MRRERKVMSHKSKILRGYGARAEEEIFLIDSLYSKVNWLRPDFDNFAYLYWFTVFFFFVILLIFNFVILLILLIFCKYFYYKVTKVGNKSFAIKCCKWQQTLHVNSKFDEFVIFLNIVVFLNIVDTLKVVYSNFESWPLRRCVLSIHH